MADVNSGPGWYEVINARNATTCIALVHEDGSLYLPEGADALTPDEFAFAAARGNAHRLVRADEVTQPEDTRPGCICTDDACPPHCPCHADETAAQTEEA